MSEKKPLENVKPLESNRCEHWWDEPRHGQIECTKCAVTVPVEEVQGLADWREHEVLKETDFRFPVEDLKVDLLRVKRGK